MEVRPERAGTRTLSEPNIEGQWIGRPWIARAIRVFVLVVPFAASVAFAWVLSGLLPSVSTWPMAILRWLLIALVSTSVMVAFDRVTRRLLPLAVLLSLTLAFPDQAPSRFKVALRIGTTLQLRRIIADARAGRIGETPAEAAEKLLELVGALSVHDRLTRGHSERVRAYTHMVGEELKITGPALDHLRWSALLHDIGKLLVSAEILNKPGKLTDVEYEAVKQHPEFGRELVTPLVGWLGDSARAVWEHHERWDGMGYPRGIAGTDISLAARIVAVTDAFDVMTSARSYKEPISPVEARAELARCAGSQFDAAIVRAFLNVSLGRLRMAMGPLSWLTQLSFIPQTLATAGATGATAVTAVVGLGAGAFGIVLGDDDVFSSTGTEQTASAPYLPGDVVDSRRVAIGDGGAPSTTVVVTSGEPDDVTVAASTSTIAIPRSTTTTLPLPVPSTVTTLPTSVTTRPRVVTAGTTPTETTVTQETPPVASSPEATVPPPTAGPDTTPATTAPVVSTPPSNDFVFYLSSPGSGDVASQLVLPLTVDSPAAAAVPNYDTDRDNDAGLLLKHDSGPESEQRFHWDTAQAISLRGAVMVELFATGRNHNGSFALDVWLRSCRGSVCTDLAYRRQVADSPDQGFGPMTFDLGTIDAVLAAGDALELVILTPTASGRHVWLAYDTAAAASRIVFVGS
ncbi:MAG TPA: HD-GYP domain-containing protein [Ilumatobacteraceae bacterium]|nr:HD-GYP domain-containing protein [Ilumatobacteraceae bacterium]